MTRAWDTVLAAEGLQPLDDGYRMQSQPRPSVIRRGRDEWTPRMLSLTLDDAMALDGETHGASRCLMEQVNGSVWDLSARYDHLAAAVHRFPFEAAKDRRICAAAAGGVPWAAIAACLRVSKTRVQRVIDAAMAWRDPERDADQGEEA